MTFKQLNYTFSIKMIKEFIIWAQLIMSWLKRTILDLKLWNNWLFTVLRRFNPQKSLLIVKYTECLLMILEGSLRYFNMMVRKIVIMINIINLMRMISHMYQYKMKCLKNNKFMRFIPQVLLITRDVLNNLLILKKLAEEMVNLNK